MKTYKTMFVTFATLTVAAAIFTGCAAANRLFTKTPNVEPRTIEQPIIGLTTNPVTGVIGLGVVGTTNLTLSASNNNWQLSPKAAASIETGKAVAGLLPEPLASILLLGLTGASGLLGVYARHKSGELTLTNAILETVVTGVELANSTAVKEAISKQSLNDGTAVALDAKVQSLTLPKT